VVQKTFFSGLGAQYNVYDGNYIWVTNPGDDNVAKFSATGLVATYQTGQSVPHTGALSPDGITYDGTNIWVTNYAVGEVVKLSGTTGTILNTIKVGGNPRFLATDKVHVWVTVPDKRPATADTIKKIAIQANNTDAIVASYDVPATYPYATVYDGTYVWATQATNRVIKLHGATGAVVGDYPAGKAPNGIAYDGTYIWISDQVCGCVPGIHPGCTSCPPGTVMKLRASDGAFMGKYYVGQRPQWVTWDGTYVWVTNGTDGTVSRCIF
jgi:DNA-binding beta-propeller fold protein YncE